MLGIMCVCERKGECLQASHEKKSQTTVVETQDRTHGRTHGRMRCSQPRRRRTQTVVIGRRTDELSLPLAEVRPAFVDRDVKALQPAAQLTHGVAEPNAVKDSPDSSVVVLSPRIDVEPQSAREKRWVLLKGNSDGWSGESDERKSE